MPAISKRPSRRLVYVQISAERIVLRRVATGDVIDEVPQIALDVNGQPAGFGRAAVEAAEWRPDLRLVNGFSHPRCVVGEMDVAAVTLKWFLDRLVKPGMRLPLRKRRSHDLVLHPIGVRDLSGLEAWGLQRIAEQAGATRVRIWLGEEPPYEALVSGVPVGGGSYRIGAPPKLKR